MNLQRPITFLDIEATGLDPVEDRIVEFSMCLLMPDLKKKIFSQRFNPGMPIPAETTAIHGITDADVADCPAFSAVAPKIVKALEGKDIAGYNLYRLDLPMLDEELRRCGLRLDLTGVHVIDCFGIFSKKEGRKLEDAVRKFCGREHANKHGARGDAIATAEVFLGELEAYPDLKDMDLGELAKFSQVNEHGVADLAGKLYIDGDGDVAFAFGKCKGRKVRDEQSFASWMLSKDFPKSTKEVLLAELERLGAMAY